MEIKTSGVYRFQSDSTIRMYGYLCQDAFNPSDPSRNLLSKNDQNCGLEQLWLNSTLLSNTTYILVVTTYLAGWTGAFTIQAFGAAEINFKLISE